MDVLLEDAGAFGAGSGIRDNLLDLIEVFGHLNALPSIRVLTWLDDPNVFGRLLCPVEALFLLFLGTLFFARVTVSFFFLFRA